MSDGGLAWTTKILSSAQRLQSDKWLYDGVIFLSQGERKKWSEEKTTTFFSPNDQAARERKKDIFHKMTLKICCTDQPRGQWLDNGRHTHTPHRHTHRNVHNKKLHHQPRGKNPKSILLCSLSFHRSLSRWGEMAECHWTIFNISIFFFITAKLRLYTSCLKIQWWYLRGRGRRQSGWDDQFWSSLRLESTAEKFLIPDKTCGVKLLSVSPVRYFSTPLFFKKPIARQKKEKSQQGCCYLLRSSGGE